MGVIIGEEWENEASLGSWTKRPRGPLFVFQFVKYLKIFNQTLLYFTAQNKIIFWALFSLKLRKPPWIISNYL